MSYIFLPNITRGGVLGVIVKGAVTKKQVKISIGSANEENVREGGMPLLLKEVRWTVEKNHREHSKLLFNLLVTEDELLISSKCRDVKNPILTGFVAMIVPYLEPDDIKAFKRIIKSIYKKKQAS